MKLLNRLNELLAHEFEEVIKTSLVLELMSLYKILFNNDEEPSGCSLCHRNYYNKLKTNGKEKAIEMEKVIERTCKPSWNGNKYFSKAARHYSNKTLTDEQALRGLEMKVFSEKDFEILPNEYSTKEDYTSDEKECIDEFKTMLTDGSTKKEIVDAFKGVMIGEKKATVKLLNELIEAAK